MFFFSRFFSISLCVWLLSYGTNWIHASDGAASATSLPAHTEVVRVALPTICSHLVDPDGITTPAFKKLCEDIAAPSAPSTLEEAVALAQGKAHEGYTWLRSGERFNVTADGSLTEVQADAVIAFCHEAGFFADHPIPESIQALLIMGSTLQRVRAQTLSLAAAVAREPALATMPVFYVAGERVLAETAGETQEALYSPPRPWREGYVLPEVAARPVVADERDMVRLVAAQSLPAAFEDVRFAMAAKRDGAPRATTADCMKVWFETSPPAGVYAIVSSNPFAGYQELVATRQALINGRKDVAFIGCGPAITPESYIAKMGKIGVAKVLLDNFARILYEMYHIKQMESSAA